MLSNSIMRLELFTCSFTHFIISLSVFSKKGVNEAGGVRLVNDDGLGSESEIRVCRGTCERENASTDE